MKNKFLQTDSDEDDLPVRLSFTDASSFAASAVVFTDQEDALIKQWFFDEDTQAEPIYLKEALAIYWQLEDFRAELSSKRLIHFCDNQVVVLAFNGQGSKTPKLQNIIKLIYVKLHKMGSRLVLYWVNTENQLADEASRFIDYNEEFVPQILFNELCNKLKITPSLDAFASKANRKCPKWINFGIHSDPNCVAFDFFTVKPSALESEILWIFPPKNLINQTIAHLVRYFRKHRFLLVFHSFGEIPLALPSLLDLGGRLHSFSRFPATIIPAEKELIFKTQKFWGIWNEKPRATKIVTLNI